MMRSLFRYISPLMFLCILAALQTGCSGGGGDTVAGGGIGGTGVTVASVGTATGFGSVIVNGIPYDTTAAEVFVENTFRGSGDAAVIQNLAVGMVVRVEGRLADDGRASADRVFFSNKLKGPVESISKLDSLTKQVVVLRQTVLMDDRTVFRSVTIDSIAVGMVLEVSGYDDGSGEIFATYVNKVADSLPPGGLVEIKGLVQKLIPPLKTFEIGGLAVDYSASDLSGLPGNAPEEGQLLKVRGRMERADRLAAERLDPEEEFGSGVFDVVEIEGIITQTGALGEFGIGRYTVSVDQETSYNNLTPQDLNRGARVIVRGTLTGRDILADEIFSFEKIRMESNVSSVDPVAKSLVLSGLEAATILTTATTRILGIAQGLDDISQGDHARVLARRTAGGDILASTIVVTPSKDSVEIAGQVESVSDPLIVVLGIQVNTSIIPSDGFKGEGGNPVSPAEFFGTVKPGDSVAVEGALQGGSVNWTGIKIESRR
jgi:hypothetical protein